MATTNKNLSTYIEGGIGDISEKKFAIIVSEWNNEITDALYSGAYETLLNEGAKKEYIQRINVPGSYELTLASQWMAERPEIDAVICLGCVIQGETKHFDFICDSIGQGLKDVSLKFNKPVIFGVLTPNNHQQAIDRAGGKHGNKGDEAAITAIKMISLKDQLQESNF
ncbi:MAG: 6,7-dimethyl-8-ribityllumazine synthase [Candidatus Cyclobacteriaceae bacterium M2_1C_046]